MSQGGIGATGSSPSVNEFPGSDKIGSVQPPENPASADSTESTIRSTVKVLVDELGAGSIVELLEAFLTETPRSLDELKLLAGGIDQPTLRRAAHSLKGSAALFGVSELEAAAQELEISAANAHTEGQTARVASLREIYDRTRPVLQKVLQELKG